jgi:hypothetical protein
LKLPNAAPEVFTEAHARLFKSPGQICHAAQQELART